MVTNEAANSAGIQGQTQFLGEELGGWPHSNRGVQLQLWSRPARLANTAMQGARGFPGSGVQEGP